MQLLENVPDFSSWKEAASWIKEGQRLSITKCENFVSLECQEKGTPPFGLYGSKKWRQFVLATFLADLLCYSTPSDQVEFNRLLFVMHAFPEGFRVWWGEFQGTFWPVGYTGWYPMLETSFELFRKEPEKLKNRMVVPNLSTESNKPIYLFNFSVIPALKKSRLSKELMKKYVEDIKAQKPSGMGCITVSDDGARIAKRLELSVTGQVNGEDVYSSSQSKA